MDYVIGVDLGGTNTKVAFVGEEGAILQRMSYATPKPFEREKWLSGLEAVLSQMKDAVSGMDLKGMGVGIAGLVNSEEGIILHAPNIRNVDGWAMKEDLVKRFGTLVAIENDVNVVALGEYLFEENGARNIIVLTLGTGVGGGLILNGELYRGSHFMAGELGHITINENGPICNCGNEGCAETYLGNQRIANRFKEILKEGRSSSVTDLVDDIDDITPEVIYEAAKKGDELSLQIWNKVAQHLATLLAGLINLLNPDKIIIGGGVAGAYDLIEQPLWTHLNKRVLKPALKGLTIRKSKLGADAGVVGAASLILKKGEIS